ncbi:MAG: DUF1588 domain-containing protein [Deltaproteobacteria bacterium]|nr:DUF1588 domain-containing protein [Deltaproteobacteria bacterium]
MDSALRPEHAVHRLALTLFFLAAAGCLAERRETREVTEPSPAPVAVCDPPSVDAEAGLVRLLTSFEYTSTVRDLFLANGLVTTSFPEENRTLGLDNDARSHSVSPLLIDQQLAAAEAIAKAVVARGDKRWFGCAPAEMSLECFDELLSRFLPRAFRRPVSAEESAVYRELFQTGESAPDGLEVVIAAVLVSPQFLYRIEASPAPSASSVEPVDAFELATRVSYFVTGSLPDDELFAKAASGELLSDTVLESQVRRLFQTDSARLTFRHFQELWLGTDALARTVKDAAAFPEWSPSLRDSLRGSAAAFVEGVVFGAGTYRALLTDSGLWLDRSLAPLYGFEAPPIGDGFRRYSADPRERSGILTQPALLARYALPTQTSPIQRGVFVLDAILCDPVDPPPPVAIVPPDPDPRASTRERFREHTKNPACARCHERIDPVGFGFEGYDALGRFRITENGQPVDVSGNVVGSREAALEGPFMGAVELADRIARSPQAAGCFATRWFRYALGRVEGPRDVCSLENAKASFLASGGRFEDLVVAIASSDAFRLKAKETP